MRRYIAAILILLLPLVMAACGNDTKDTKQEESSSTVQNAATLHTDKASEPDTEPEQELQGGSMEEREEGAVETDQIYIQVGESILTAVLEDNESVEALKGLLADGPVTISASNYGGFEKVCSLGAELPRNDSQTTTHAGDICLYNGNQIVIFYGSNSWAYTRLGKVSNADETELETVLSGGETEITLSLGPIG